MGTIKLSLTDTEVHLDLTMQWKGGLSDLQRLLMQLGNPQKQSMQPPASTEHHPTFTLDPAFEKNQDGGFFALHLQRGTLFTLDEVKTVGQWLTLTVSETLVTARSVDSPETDFMEAVDARRFKPA